MSQALKVIVVILEVIGLSCIAWWSIDLIRSATAAFRALARFLSQPQINVTYNSNVTVIDERKAVTR